MAGRSMVKKRETDQTQRVHSYTRRGVQVWLRLDSVLEYAIQYRYPAGGGRTCTWPPSAQQCA